MPDGKKGSMGFLFVLFVIAVWYERRDDGHVGFVVWTNVDNSYVVSTEAIWKERERLRFGECCIYIYC